MLMLVLLGVRIIYYAVIVSKPLKSFFYDDTDKENNVFKVLLIVPYITEVILNSLIFYVNFIQ
jgi:hypothetical protein